MNNAEKCCGVDHLTMLVFFFANDPQEFLLNEDIQ